MEYAGCVFVCCSYVHLEKYPDPDNGGERKEGKICSSCLASITAPGTVDAEDGFDWYSLFFHCLDNNFP